MPHHGPRKTAPRVRDGRVQKKNRHDPTPTYWNTRQMEPWVDKERPGRGYKHLLTKQDVLDFVHLLPEWETLCQGLDAIVLVAGSASADGWYQDGVICLAAWPRDLHQLWSRGYFEDHREVIELLDVPTRSAPEGVWCEFTEASARAFQLTHVLLHELGHHADRMSTRSQWDCPRGEGFAEGYALEHAPTIWTRYCERFGW